MGDILADTVILANARIFTTFEKQSMINRLSNPINRNRSAAKISKVMGSNSNAMEPQIGGKKLANNRKAPQDDSRCDGNEVAKILVHGATLWWERPDQYPEQPSLARKYLSKEKEKAVWSGRVFVVKKQEEDATIIIVWKQEVCSLFEALYPGVKWVGKEGRSTENVHYGRWQEKIQEEKKTRARH